MLHPAMNYTMLTSSRNLSLLIIKGQPLHVVKINHAQPFLSSISLSFLKKRTHHYTKVKLFIV